MRIKIKKRKVIAAFLSWLLAASFCDGQDITPVGKDYLLGKFNPATEARFSLLRDEHTSGSARGGYLRKETYEAFIKMAEAAMADGISLKIISATRNFESQKRIWEDKWNGRTIVEGIRLTSVTDLNQRAKTILRYSSMPGSSRHHWGTDVDLNNLENDYFRSGDGLQVYTWLQAHAAEYGFCQPYTGKQHGRTGYEEEKWHWSYTPLSIPFLKEYLGSIREKDIAGFDGAETAGPVNLIAHYVSGVSCR
jgi:zinc D-Ala-D-Ala carboxypeptidase